MRKALRQESVSQEDNGAELRELLAYLRDQESITARLQQFVSATGADELLVSSSTYDADDLAQLDAGVLRALLGMIACEMKPPVHPLATSSCDA